MELPVPGLFDFHSLISDFDTQAIKLPLAPVSDQRDNGRSFLYQEVCMTIPQSELQGLFPRFAAPLINGEAAKRFGEAVAKQLAQTFWQMMIDGPKSEAYLWKSFGDSFTADDITMLRQCFEEEMKPSLNASQLTAIGGWYRKGEDEEFAVGDQVRVRHGTVDPDYSDLPLGGWAGTIVKVDDDGLCHIKLNQATLDHIHPVYRKRCKRDDFHIEILDMDQEDLDPDLGEGLAMEEPTNIQTKPLDPAELENRIRAALGVTTDDAVPFVEKETLLKYFDYLKATLVFPFPATYSHHDGKRHILHNISVVSMSDEFPIEDEYGLVCKVKDEKKGWEVPLMLMDVGKDDRNHQLVKDYDRWFAQWGDFVPPSYPHVSNDEPEEVDDEPEPLANRKIGRNDPCPCGSGKKFKKCCLNKGRQGSIFD